MNGRILVIVGAPQHACEQDIRDAGFSHRSPQLIYVGDRHNAYRVMGIDRNAAKWCFVGGDDIHDEVFERMEAYFGPGVNLADGIRWIAETA